MEFEGYGRAEGPAGSVLAGPRLTCVRNGRARYDRHSVSAVRISEFRWVTRKLPDPEKGMGRARYSD